MGQNKKLVIIDYDMGNVRSVAKAFEIIGSDALISRKPSDIESADYLVLPGVGAFARGMEHLRKMGLVDILTKEVINKKKPFLGICLGMQLLAKNSEEFGSHKGLDWVDAEVKAFDFSNKQLKVPHVGWNSITFKEDCPLFRGVKQYVDFYFVHNYHMICNSEDMVAAKCNYGYDFVAAIEKDNIFATQFHPEKSQTYGLKILENFLNF